MSEIGKSVRMERIFDRSTGNTIIVPMDHGVGAGPIKGLIDMPETVNKVAQGGANAVLGHINVGAEDESEMLQDLGFVAERCDEWGMPLLAMMYPRGKKVDSEHDVEYVKHAARIGAELGADIVKTNYTGDIDSFKEVVKGCPVPIVIAGGPQMNTEQELLEMVYDSLIAGGKGASIGRNVFQSDDSAALVSKMSKIVHGRMTVEEAMQA